MSNETAQDLRAALDLLERNGWCQRSYATPNGEHCAAGAVMVVAPSYERERAAGEALRAVPAARGRLTSYNDKPGRRFSTIRHWFERAIAAEETS